MDCKGKKITLLKDSPNLPYKAGDTGVIVDSFTMNVGGHAYGKEMVPMTITTLDIRMDKDGQQVSTAYHDSVLRIEEQP